MRTRTLIASTACLAVLALAALGGIWLTRDTGQPGTAGTDTAANEALAEPGSVPIGGPFTLTDHTGKTVTDRHFVGKLLLVFFGFTHCPDICPTTLGDVALALDRLGPAGAAVQPLFISVDPTRDTPERLAEYVAVFHPRIVGLTGTEEQIAAVAKAYRVFYEKVGATTYEGDPAQEGDDAAATGGDYLMSHSANTYLMSPDGEYLAHFSYGTTPERMAETIRKALAKFGSQVN